MTSLASFLAVMNQLVIIECHFLSIIGRHSSTTSRHHSTIVERIFTRNNPYQPFCGPCSLPFKPMFTHVYPCLGPIFTTAYHDEEPMLISGSPDQLISTAVAPQGPLRLVVITGTSSGLGKMATKALLRAGAGTRTRLT